MLLVMSPKRIKASLVVVFFKGAGGGVMPLESVVPVDLSGIVDTTTGFVVSRGDVLLGSGDPVTGL